jgi:hypothetical protein
MRSLLVLVVFSALAVRSGTVAAQDSAFIVLAQRTPVSSLDSGYADVPLDKWLATLVRMPASAISWEVNDCGEGGDGQQAPTCVEAWVALTPDTGVSVSVIVAGLDGAPAPPHLWMLYAREGQHVTPLANLRDLTGYVQSRLP